SAHVQWLDSPGQPQPCRRRLSFGSLTKDVVGLPSTARSSFARVAAHALAVRHNIARTKQAHGTLRHRPEVSRANLGVDLFQSGGVLSARRKVLFQFFVPNELILPRDERGELGQLFAAQLFNSLFYFRQAHAHTVAAAAPEANQIAARSGFRVLDGVPLERARW